jgi:hypothetical protein
MHPFSQSILLACVALAGCVPDDPPPVPAQSPTSHKTPTTRPASLPSPPIAPTIPEADRFTAVLERRWPLEKIRRHATPDRRHWNGCQNLVAGFPCANGQESTHWAGKLFEGETTGFDEVSWYANVCGGKIDEYSLNARRDDDFWLLEIGGLESLKRAPMVEPPTDDQCYEGGDHSMYR